ncbi:MAG: polysaccharide deacetylase family protein [Acidimicrobiales bacterium]
MSRAHIPILLYHSVCADPPAWIAPFTVTPETFNRHLELVVASGRQALGISEFVERITDPAPGEPFEHPPVVITFDDGFADFVTHAGPMMAARHLPSTLYVSTGSLRASPGRTPYAPTETVLPLAEMMRWDDLVEAESYGAEIGAHSHTHPQLDLLTADEAREEIRTSRDSLEQALGHRVRSFAYPHGHSTPRVRSIVANLGFDSGAGVRNRFSSAIDDPFNIARLTVRADTSDATLAAWLDGRSAPGASLLEAPKSMLGRTVRRMSPRRAYPASV